MTHAVDEQVSVKVAIQQRRDLDVECVAEEFQVCIGAPLSMAAYAVTYVHSCLNNDERQWLANKFQSIPGRQKLTATRREA